MPDEQPANQPDQKKGPDWVAKVVDFASIYSEKLIAIGIITAGVTVGILMILTQWLRTKTLSEFELLMFQVFSLPLGIYGSYRLSQSSLSEPSIAEPAFRRSAATSLCLSEIVANVETSERSIRRKINPADHVDQPIYSEAADTLKSTSAQLRLLLPSLADTLEDWKQVGPKAVSKSIADSESKRQTTRKVD